MDGSSYEGDNLKVQKGQIQKQVHKVDGSPYKGDECSPKWTDIKHDHKMEGPSHEDDDWKSKTDESKISPGSGRIALQG